MVARFRRPITSPGLERFMLIGDGVLVVPGARGRDAVGGRRAHASTAR